MTSQEGIAANSHSTGEDIFNHLQQRLAALEEAQRDISLQSLLKRVEFLEERLTGLSFKNESTVADIRQEERPQDDVRVDGLPIQNQPNEVSSSAEKMSADKTVKHSDTGTPTPTQMKADSHALSINEVQEEAARKLHHTLDESIYEAMLLVGLNCIGKRDSVLAVIGFALNVAMQCIMIGIIKKTFLSDQLPSAEVVMEWRLAAGQHLDNLAPLRHTSLVSRVCGMDPTLLVSSEKQALIHTIDQYTTGPAGVFLSMLAILCWFFYISKELAKSFGFLLAVYYQPGGATKISRDDEGTNRLLAINAPRKILMALTTILRMFLAIMLLMYGSIWLANTINVTDLVLNAAALAFILEFDETWYEVCMSWPGRVLISELAPLPMPAGSLGSSSSWYISMLQLVFASVHVTTLLFLTILPLMGQMEDIMETMCGDPKDFVYAQHESGIIMAAHTNPYIRDADVSPVSIDIRTVIDAGSIAGAQSMLLLQNVNVLQSAMRRPMDRMVRDLTRIILKHGCEDNDFSVSFFPEMGATLRRVLQNPDITSCRDVRPYCDDLSPAPRLICPATCGCSLPRSGLFQQGEKAGCPREDCQAAPKYQEALKQIPCQNPTPAELSAMPAWAAFWEGWSATMSDMSPEMRGHIQAAKVALLRDGCSGMSLLRKEWAPLCQGTPSGGSMADFCPVTCNCSLHHFPSCPSAC